MKTLILGGVRSGKSAYAQKQAKATGLPVSYIATATAGDDEMRRRIEQHQCNRPQDWTVVEEPHALATVLQRHARRDHCVLVDCLTLWLSNLLCSADKELFEQERDALFSVLPTLEGQLFFVSNEVGLGIMPLGELSRRFADEAGSLHQALAEGCDRVILTVAGLGMEIK